MTDASPSGIASLPDPWVFFYGSFINRDVLSKYGVTPRDIEVAWLGGFDICIRPLATLVHDRDRHVYGILTRVNHAQLDGLYGEEWVAAYRPYAVVVETLTDKRIAALCYIAPVTDPTPAESDYIDRIVGPARELGFPGWYVRRIEEYRR